MLHYTSGGSQPDNACTKAAGAASNTASSDPGNQPVHFLLESPLAGYAGLSFPAKKGAMSPADAVIGSVDAATGKPTVSAYHLTDYSPQPSATNFNAAGWASSMGAGKDGGKTLLCFTRPTTAPNAAVVKTLDLKGERAAVAFALDEGCVGVGAAMCITCCVPLTHVWRRETSVLTNSTFLLCTLGALSLSVMG